MKKGSLVIIVGSLIVVFGIIFHLQGQSIVGPESSFMYSNPDWIAHGIQIAIIGSSIIGVGIVIKILKKG
ncbi:MAG: hypothetical protein ACE5DU_01170 [Nitrosopumilus sp.]